MSDTLLELLIVGAKILFGATIFLVTSWLISLVNREFYALTHQIKNSLTEAEEYLKEKLFHPCFEQFISAWEKYKTELQSTTDALVNNELLKMNIHDRVNYLKTDLELIEDGTRLLTISPQISVNLPEIPSNSDSIEDLKHSVQENLELVLDEKNLKSYFAEYFNIGIYGFLIIAIIGLNTFLMKEFFEGMGLTQILMRNPIRLTYAHLLAVFMGVFELTLGIVHYTLEEKKSDVQERGDFFSIAPLFVWFGITSMVIVESVAYGVLSKQLEVPQSLGLNPESSAMYEFTSYFLSFLGFSITLMITILGYLIWKTTYQVVLEKGSVPVIKFKSDLEKIVSISRTYGDNADRLEQQLNHAQEVITELEKYREPEKIEEVQFSVDKIKEKIFGAIEEIRDYMKKEPRVVPIETYQSFANIALYCLLFFIWTYVAYSLANTFSQSLYGIIQSTLAVPFGWVLALNLAIFGYVLKLIFTYSKIESAKTSVEGIKRRGNWVLQIIAALASVAIIFLIGLILYLNLLSLKENIYLLVIEMLFLFLLSFWIERYVFAVAVAFRQIFFSFLLGVYWMMQVLLLVLNFLILVAEYFIQFYTIPGEKIKTIKL